MVSVGLLLGLPALLAANAYATRDEVLSGVRVSGVDLGGLSRQAARERLVRELGQRLGAPISLQIAGKTGRVVPTELGIGIDLDRTVDRALSAGRLEGRLLPWLFSASIEPVVTLPPSLRLPKPLASVERAPRDARPVVAASGRVSVEPAADGVAIEARSALQAIVATALRRDNVLTLTPQVTAPAISTATAQTTADQAAAVLAAPIAVASGTKHLGQLTKRELAPLLRVKKQAGKWALSITPNGIAAALAEATRGIARPPRDASWRTDGSAARVIASHPGRDVDGAKTASAVLAAAATTDRVAQVALGPREAALTTAAAKALGIRKKIASATTSLGASTANRVFNVRLMAQFLDGQVIQPGDSFSFNARVGPRTAARGFKEGQAIVGGLLIPSIGGGVCQVATTVFDAAFYAGFPVVSRLNHAWYISHYPIGMDATVADGGPDLIFRNDSAYGVLIRASVGTSTMTVDLYSTNRGYEVTKTTGPQLSFVEPKPRYILNPSLKGTQKVKKTIGVRGFTVTVERTVTQRGKVVRTDSFSSRYVPESILYVVGKKFVPKDGGIVEKAPPAFTF